MLSRDVTPAYEVRQTSNPGQAQSPLSLALDTYKLAITSAVSEEKRASFINSREMRRDDLVRAWENYLTNYEQSQNPELLGGRSIAGIVTLAAIADRTLSGFGKQYCERYHCPAFKLMGIPFNESVDLIRDSIAFLEKGLKGLLRLVPDSKVEDRVCYFHKVLNAVTFIREEKALQLRTQVEASIKSYQKKVEKSLKALNKVEEELKSLKEQGDISDKSFDQFEDSIQKFRGVQTSLVAVCKSIFTEHMIVELLHLNTNVLRGDALKHDLTVEFEDLHYDISAHEPDESVFEDTSLLRVAELTMDLKTPEFSCVTDRLRLLKKLTANFREYASHPTVAAAKENLISAIIDELRVFSKEELLGGAADIEMPIQALYDYNLVDKPEAKVTAKGNGEKTRGEANIVKVDRNKLSQLKAEASSLSKQCDPENIARQISRLSQQADTKGLEAAISYLKILKAAKDGLSNRKDWTALLRAFSQLEKLPPADKLPLLITRINEFLDEGVRSTLRQSSLQKYATLLLSDNLYELRRIKGLRLEPLKYREEDLYSVRVNDLYRLVFKIGHAKEISAIRVVDYHTRKNKTT